MNLRASQDRNRPGDRIEQTELQLPTPRFRGQLLPVAVFTAEPSSWIDGPKSAELVVHDASTAVPNPRAVTTH